MRRLLGALAAGGVLAAAVYGAAASLGGITAQQLGADSTAIVSCDSDGIRLGWGGLGSAGAGQYLSAVRLSGIHDNCIGAEFIVYAFDSASNTIGTGNATLAAADGPANDNQLYVGFLGSPPIVEDIVRIEVFSAAP